MRNLQLLCLFSVLLVGCLVGAQAQSPALPKPKRAMVPTPKPSIQRAKGRQDPLGNQTPMPLEKKEEIPKPQILPPLQNPPIRIGYLIQSKENPWDDKWYSRLKAYLMNDPELLQAMKAEHISDIWLSQCDGYADMLQRMALRELDVVFCPAMVYVRDRIANGPNYRVIYKVFRGETNLSSTRSPDQIRHDGVLFVRRGCHVDMDTRKGDPEEIKRALQGKTIAIAGPYDAAGGFYIKKMLWDDYGLKPKFIYLGAPRDVVKAVTCGLLDVGACERTVYRQVFQTLPQQIRNQHETSDNIREYGFPRIIASTISLSTDPVLIHKRFDPTDSKIGYRIFGSIKAFCNDTHTKRGDIPRVKNSADSDFEPMVVDVQNAGEYE